MRISGGFWNEVFTPPTAFTAGRNCSITSSGVDRAFLSRLQPELHASAIDPLFALPAFTFEKNVSTLRILRPPLQPLRRCAHHHIETCILGNSVVPASWSVSCVGMKPMGNCLNT